MRVHHLGGGQLRRGTEETSYLVPHYLYSIRIERSNRGLRRGVMARCGSPNMGATTSGASRQRVDYGIHRADRQEPPPRHLRAREWKSSWAGGLPPKFNSRLDNLIEAAAPVILSRFTILSGFGFLPNGYVSREIVGVVGDVRDVALSQKPGPMMHVPFAQAPLYGGEVVVRSSLSASSVATAIRQAQVKTWV